MKTNKQIFKYIIINIFILTIIYLFYLNDIRVCLVYNLFKFPCPGCGLTRSIIHILNMNIEESIQYNILGLPILVMFVVINIWILIDIIMKKQTIRNFIQKNKKIIIVISIILFLISLIKNINNPILY